MVALCLYEVLPVSLGGAHVRVCGGLGYMAFVKAHGMVPLRFLHFIVYIFNLNKRTLNLMNSS